MIYLLSVFVLIAIAVLGAWPRTKHRKGKPLESLVDNGLVFLAAAPIIFSFWIAWRMDGGGGIAGDTSMRLSVVLMTIGGVGTAIFNGYRLYRERSNYPVVFSVLTIVAGVYLTFVGIDHLQFFDGEQSGIVNMQYYQEEGKVRDIPTDCGPIALVDRVMTETATYRCPHKIVLGSWVSEPFVPWPGYNEGQSRDLAAAIQATYENATRTKN